ncbi:DNA-3-methyladenine glycosylase [Anaerococcus sp. DFU013_CI05]|uniref:DNA-3-methyladenine glycosylase n=1 Tax=unclassified Anaerococcus TaxID=2614126 RepID=UPI001931FA46|nr:DNA-3-methyladenine glycosylase [Anaerococcus sp. mt242]MBM0045821.1 DNA-3-methyladenine glycosylase [Anaerococcus sp. mt242]
MLSKEFFSRDTLTVAKDLLGKVIVKKDNGIIYRAKIVETEAYLGIEDRAAHTFGDRKTDRNKIMYEDAGTIYVYQTYGIHFMLNFVTQDKNIPEAVLIRAVEPLNQFDNISKNRFGKYFDDLSAYQKKNLTNGPGKLTKALSIDKSLNGKDLFDQSFYVEDDDSIFDIIIDKRIGIDYSKEAIDYPYRFYIKDNSYVSVLKK